MENEKLIATSELCNIRKIRSVLTIAGIILIAAAVGLYVLAYFRNIKYWKDLYKKQAKSVVEDINSHDAEYALSKHDSADIVKKVAEKNKIDLKVVYAGQEKIVAINEDDISKFATKMRRLKDSDLKAYAKEEASLTELFMMYSQYAWASLIAGIVCIIAGILYYKSSRDISVTVTDRRVYGNKNWGRDVQIAMSQVNSVSSRGKNGLVINTSGGNVKFTHIQNRDEIVSAISECFVKR